MQVSLSNIAVRLNEFGSTVGRLGGRVVEVISKHSPEIKKVGVFLINSIALGVFAYIGFLFLRNIKDYIIFNIEEAKAKKQLKVTKKEDEPGNVIKNSATTTLKIKIEGRDPENITLESENDVKLEEAKNLAETLNGKFVNIVNNFMRCRRESLKSKTKVPNLVEDKEYQNFKTEMAFNRYVKSQFDHDLIKKCYIQIEQRIQNFEDTIDIIEKSPKLSLGKLYNHLPYCSLSFRNKIIFLNYFINQKENENKSNDKNVKDLISSEDQTILKNEIKKTEEELKNCNKGFEYLNIKNPIIVEIEGLKFLV